jgi:hypothetical protein
MTVNEMAQKLGYKTVNNQDSVAEKMSTPVTGVYACDLLSHAMAKVNEGDVWITVHTNLNVIAVASLTNCACVMIPENIDIESQSIERANDKGVVLLSSSKSAAHICHEILSALKDMK